MGNCSLLGIICMKAGVGLLALACRMGVRLAAG
jgi:hypothetical protein